MGPRTDDASDEHRTGWERHGDLGCVEAAMGCPIGGSIGDPSSENVGL